MDARSRVKKVVGLTIVHNRTKDGGTGVQSLGLVRNVHDVIAYMRPGRNTWPSD